ncbi:cytochrome C oxidase subunit IV family protein [Haloferula sp.]|uniref:cytochrome C oxidase subunit IV family protein n=1 Tax=Haloferula sp. TaxID=2497595 RepID=UPI00329CD78E
MADTPEAIKKSQKLYLFIGLCLFIGTIVTVAVATVPALDVGGHGFDKWDMILGLCIASFKVALVMYFFMHLNHEKGWVYGSFALAIVMAFFLAFLLFLAKGDPIKYDKFSTGGVILPSCLHVKAL